ncbi:MAG TPA: type II toxin-antitoxin system prevent-host-death family antitoxin [Pyrinomonadaceae bacterium]|nr:type II toxin-antitoxin system prevent-host-death family antitoxin [Pyrinomonadaceae bacterium]
MMKQVTVTDLQRHAADVISNLDDGPVIVSQRGRPAAVILTAQAFEELERALEEVEQKRVIEVIEAGLASSKAGRTSPHATRRVRQKRARRA